MPQMRRDSWRGRSSNSSSLRDASICGRSRASRRRSIGRRRCCASASTGLDHDASERIVESLAALIKTREDRVGFTREVVARIAAAC